MSPVALSIDEQEDHLLRLLESPTECGQPELTDDLYARVADAVRDPGASDFDLAVLVRHLLRRLSLRDKRAAQVTVAPSIAERLERVASTVRLRRRTGDRWSALAWEPDWLDRDGAAPDAAAAAGTSGGERFHGDDLAADPFFTDWTTFEHYRTPGQRAACRAVVSSPAGSTLTAMLPTGSGKTEVALCLAEQRPYQVTLVIVPTVALAHDFERRFREHYARKNRKINSSALHFAWTAGTGKDERERLRGLVVNGRQRILVTSPESMTRSLRATLLNAARTGRLGGLVVDEAHLVTQWGRSFRPEFRSLADLRRDLIDAAVDAGHPPLTTLLLSATLGPHELKDLHELFGRPGPYTLIAANALRTEPELWVAKAEDATQREEWVRETLANLPRPAILYVTSPETAGRWYTRLREIGYRRLALVTGDTDGTERARVLAEMRATGSTLSTIDLVVATSAFGLGIDYAHIRSVVHACLPETVDRWYQEFGRGGRDRHVSAAFLLTAPGDRDEASSLSVKVLTADIARERWADLWEHRRTLGGRTFIDLEGTRGSSGKGSYNRRWNAQLVQGMVELNVLNRGQIDAEDRRELAEGSGPKHDWVAVDPQHGNLADRKFWDAEWTPWQQKEARRSFHALDDILAVQKGTVVTCEAIAGSYRPDDDVLALHGHAADDVEPLTPCGRCPGCRRDGLQPLDDPPPRPPQAWPIPDDAGAKLDDLAASAGAIDGLVLLVTDDQEQIAGPLAEALVRRGVRHVAGPIGRKLSQVDRLFVDSDPISPGELTPYSSFVVFPPRSRITGMWLNSKLRWLHRAHAPQAFDVLLLSRQATVGARDLEHDLQSLDANIALDILGG